MVPSSGRLRPSQRTWSASHPSLNHRHSTRARTILIATAGLIALCLHLNAEDKTASNPGTSYRPIDSLSDEAFASFYNLEYDRSVQDFERILERHPDDPFAVNHLVTAVLFRELNRMGALNSGEYANDSFVSQAHRPADPNVKARITQLIDRAQSLEAARLQKNPDDIDALYARGVTRGLFALYTALVERAWFSALRNAVGARHDHERVLELSPGYTDAKLIVGTHQYVTGSLPWAVKTAVSLVGLSGSKEKGIEFLYDAAKSSGETSTDARIALLVFLRREHRYDEALNIARELQSRFPRNYLLQVEEGNLLRTAGKFDQAADVYRRVWLQGREGKYARGQHYEIAALALGDLLRSRKSYSEAAAAYDLVGQVQEPDPEFAQRASLASGEMYDLLKRREQAVNRYQAVIALNSQSPPADTARRRLQEPYHE